MESDLISNLDKVIAGAIEDKDYHLAFNAIRTKAELLKANIDCESPPDHKAICAIRDGSLWINTSNVLPVRAITNVYASFNRPRECHEVVISSKSHHCFSYACDNLDEAKCVKDSIDKLIKEHRRA